MCALFASTAHKGACWGGVCLDRAGPKSSQGENGCFCMTIEMSALCSICSNNTQKHPERRRRRYSLDRAGPNSSKGLESELEYTSSDLSAHRYKMICQRKIS